MITLLCSLLVVCQFTTLAQTQQYGWSVIAQPRPGYQMYAVEFKDSLHGWCEAGGQIFRTTDGGTTWNASSQPSFPNGINNISFSDTLHGWASGTFSGSEVFIWKSNDGGLTWSQKFFKDNYQLYGTAARGAQGNITVGLFHQIGIRDTGKIFSTTDGGQAWTEGTLGDTITALGNISFIDSLHGWMDGYYIDTSDNSQHPGFFRTINGGISWQLVKQVVYYFSFVDTSNGFAYTGYDNNGLFIGRTRDGGLTWQPMYLPYASVYTEDQFSPSVVSFVDTLNGWMFGDTFYQGGTAEMIIHTSDGGLTWTRESIGIAYSFADAVMLDNHHGWGVTLHGEVVGYGLITGVSDRLPDLPTGYLLRQNYPNPFNNSTIIEYEITEESDVHIAVYDMLGKLITILVNKVQPAGTYRSEFDATGLSSGIYYYRIEARQISTSRNGQATFYRNTKQLILIK